MKGGLSKKNNQIQLISKVILEKERSNTKAKQPNSIISNKVTKVKGFCTSSIPKKTVSNSSQKTSSNSAKILSTSNFNHVPINLDLAKAKGTNINIIVNNNFIKSSSINAVNELKTQSDFHNKTDAISSHENKGDKNKVGSKHFNLNSSISYSVNNYINTKKNINSSSDQMESRNKGVLNGINHVSLTFLKTSFKPRTSSLIKNIKGSSNEKVTSSPVKENLKLKKFQNYSQKMSRDNSSNMMQRNNDKGTYKMNNEINNDKKVKRVVTSLNKTNINTSAHHENSNINCFQTQPLKFEEQKDQTEQIRSTSKAKATEIKTPTFIQSSYSELAKKLQKTKPCTVRTTKSGFSANKIYFSSTSMQTTTMKKTDFVSDNNINNENEDEECMLLNSSSMSHSEVQNTQNKRIDDSKIISSQNKSLNIGDQNNIKSISIFKAMSQRVSYDYYKPKHSFGNLKSAGRSFKQIEGPEELHFTYVNLNHQQQRYIDINQGDSDDMLNLTEDKLRLI